MSSVYGELDSTENHVTLCETLSKENSLCEEPFLKTCTEENQDSIRLSTNLFTEEQDTTKDTDIATVDEELSSSGMCYKCLHCCKTFIRPDHMKSHERTHTGERPHECPHCGNSFSELSTLRKHIRTHTGEQPYQCDHCGERFKQSSNLRKHTYIHTGYRPHSCPMCEKTFIEHSAMKIHLRIHTGERPYQCSHCTKAFTRVAYLKRHLGSHTGIKPYVCSHCPKAFQRLDSLRQHVSIHKDTPVLQDTGDATKFTVSTDKARDSSFLKNDDTTFHIESVNEMHEEKIQHKCPKCNKTFRKFHFLLMHSKFHAEKKLHKCPQCDKAFKRRYDLKTHLSRVHMSQTVL